MVKKREDIAQGPAKRLKDTDIDSDYRSHLFSFQLSMAMVRQMQAEGLISSQENADIGKILTKRHGLFSCSIFA